MSERDSVFQALADPTRRRILSMLRKRDMTPGELIEAFSITKPSLSHHLDALKRADLVTTERKGQHILYSLNVSVFDEVLAAIMDLFGVERKSSAETEGGSNVQD